MHIDRRAERFRALEDRPEELVVEIAAAIVAVDHGADKAVVAHHAFEFGRGLVGRRGRHRGEAGEALGMFLHRFGQKIVGFARQRHRFGRVRLLAARRG